MVALFVRAERRGRRRLQEFVSARLLPQLAATVNRLRRALRFALQLLGLALALISLALPRWGYTFQDVKRKGLDLLVAIDTSRSMLAEDVKPNRLERAKLEEHFHGCAPCEEFLTQYRATVGLCRKALEKRMPDAVSERLKSFLHEKLPAAKKA